MHVQHINTMRWEQQNIDTKRNLKHHKAKQENKQRIKQTKQGFLIKKCLLPLIYPIEFLPLWMCTRYNFSPWECAQESYRNDETLWYAPFLFVVNRQMNHEDRGKEKKIWTMVMIHEGCKMNEKIKLTQKTKHLKKIMLQSIK